VEADGRLGSAVLAGALPGQSRVSSRPVPVPQWGPRAVPGAVAQLPAAALRGALPAVLLWGSVEGA
jgi:hypothetical protein